MTRLPHVRDRHAPMIPPAAPGGRAPTAAIAGVMLAALFLGSGATVAADWSGRETTTDGVRHVENPATPQYGSVTVDLEELWRIGGETDADGEFFGVLGQITADGDGNVYLLDSQLHEVKIFSRDGEYVRTIGHEGEGPGEFRRPSDLFLTPDGLVAVVQAFPAKIVLMTKEGEPAGEYPLPKGEGGGFSGVSGGRLGVDQVVLVERNREMKNGSMDFHTDLVRVDRSGNETARYMELTAHWNQAETVVDETDSRGWGLFWDVATDGRVFASWMFHDYAVHVWNPDGTDDRVISRAYSPLPRSEAARERVRERMKPILRWVPNGTIKVSDTERAIVGIFPRADGTVWVLSGDGATHRPDGALGVFDVFDGDGHYTRQVTLNGQGDFQEDGFFFVGDRVYVVEGLRGAQDAMRGVGGDESADTDLEPVAVICYRLDDEELAAR